MSHPIPPYELSTPFGKPGAWMAGYHTGDDYSTKGETGKPVRATRAGVVVATGNEWGSSYGTQVIIESDGIRHGYCHLRGFGVRTGDRVTAGQVIGKSGNTGNSTGPHLHYEERHAPYGYWDHRKPQFNRDTTGTGGAMRMPGAKWVGEHGSRPMDRYDVVCVHTIVGYAPAHAAHFSVSRDGTIYQSRDTRYQSGANLEGNPRVIAIETADMPPEWNTGDGHAVPDFTDAQVEAIVEIIQWCHDAHGIPIVACPDSRPGSRGVAYHRQGIDGNWAGYDYPGRVAGGETWTTSPGKVCPGDRKIKTLLDRIIPLAAGEEEDMQLNDPITEWSPDDGTSPEKSTVGQTLNQARGYSEDAFQRIKKLQKQVDEILGILKAQKKG